ncbi:hypothetical protein LCGC14_2719000 [marine sediment metagenome]|uniref:Uncharacterized protein n=1 Tax=marine sediment metagenome TaxID=412755 RepID=A0A0F9BJR2_9ZZZZ
MKDSIKCWFYCEDAPAWAACSDIGGNTKPFRMLDGELIQVCPRHFRQVALEMGIGVGLGERPL